jgi:Cu2+-exporting ATPase
MALAREAGTGSVAKSAREITGAGIEVNEDGHRLRLGRASWVCAAGPANTSAYNDDASELWFQRDNERPVRFRFQDQMRTDAGPMLDGLKTLGMDVEILSGDRQRAVARVAKSAGIATWTASADPVEKAERLKELKSQGRKVLMIGDGMNDAAALTLAHASIAPGNAIDAAQSSADIVMQGTSLWPIVQAISVARAARNRVLENFRFAAAYNLVAVPLAALGLVTPLIAAVAMASSSLIVTLNALRQSVPERR